MSKLDNLNRNNLCDSRLGNFSRPGFKLVWMTLSLQFLITVNFNTPLHAQYADGGDYYGDSGTTDGFGMTDGMYDGGSSDSGIDGVDVGGYDGGASDSGTDGIDGDYGGGMSDSGTDGIDGDYDGGMSDSGTDGIDGDYDGGMSDSDSSGDGSHDGGGEGDDGDDSDSGDDDDSNKGGNDDEDNHGDDGDSDDGGHDSDKPANDNKGVANPTPVNPNPNDDSGSSCVNPDSPEWQAKNIKIEVVEQSNAFKLTTTLCPGAHMKEYKQYAAAVDNNGDFAVTECSLEPNGLYFCGLEGVGAQARAIWGEWDKDKIAGKGSSKVSKVKKGKKSGKSKKAKSKKSKKKNKGKKGNSLAQTESTRVIYLAA